jgi:hypothetical protein
MEKAAISEDNEEYFDRKKINNQFDIKINP